MAADLGDAALGREVAVQDDQAAGLLQRLVQRARSLPAPEFPALAAFGDGLAGDGDRVLVQKRLAAGAGQQANAAGAVHVGGDEASGGLQVGEDRRALADFLEIVDVRAARRPRGRWPAGAARRWSSRWWRPRRRWRSRRLGASGCPADATPWRNRFITTSPQSQAIWSFCGSRAGTLLKPIGERPINSITVDMVLAVYWPPQAPAPGRRRFPARAVRRRSFSRRRWRRRPRRHPEW